MLRPTRTTALMALILLPAQQGSVVYGCYAVIVGREVSADGSVLLGHNEQNNGRRMLNFRRVPAQRFPNGTVVRLRRGGELPQVSRTAAYLWSQNPGLEFSDAYLNEHGVAIVSDGCGTREDDYETLVTRGEIRQGGIGYMLRRLVAQRAKTARQGVELAGMLIEQFGYVDSGRTYVIADPREAWLLAVVRGRRWVAQRVPDDAVVVFPSAGKPFNFRKAYRRDRADAPDMRRWRGRQLVGGQPAPWPPDEPPPPGIAPRRKMTVADVVRILGDKAGPGRTLSTPETQEGAVFQLRGNMPRAISCVYWRTTAEPATSVLLPFYLGITQVPPAFHRPAELKRQLSLQYHFAPPARTFEPDPHLAWWTFKTLQDRIPRGVGTRPEAAPSEWAEFERGVFARQAAVESRALELWQTDRNAARAYLTRYCTELATEALRTAAELTAKYPDTELIFE